MHSCRIEVPRSQRASATALAPRAAFLAALMAAFFLSPELHPAQQNTRFCATCGFHGVESFINQNGQLVAHASTVPFRAPPERTNNPALIEIEPQLVVVAAERAKRVLSQVLQATDDFQDKIHISVLDRAPTGQPVAVVSQVHSDG